MGQPQESHPVPESVVQILSSVRLGSFPWGASSSAQPRFGERIFFIISSLNLPDTSPCHSLRASPGLQLVCYSKVNYCCGMLVGHGKPPIITTALSAPKYLCVYVLLNIFSLTQETVGFLFYLSSCQQRSGRGQNTGLSCSAKRALTLHLLCHFSSEKRGDFPSCLPYLGWK